MYEEEGGRILRNRRDEPILSREEEERLESLEDKLDVELALKALAENDGSVPWEEAAKELED
ncbi:MAG: hypothetical protein PHU72_06685 [Dethiosulfovibrio sp.]|nr:hypothetical protein [Dethiosulfovibrio sp.]